MRLWPAAILLLAHPALSQERTFRADYPKDGVYWSETWAEAMLEAKTRNVPVHIACHDDSDSSVEMARKVHTDRKFIEASRMWVNVAVHGKYGHEVDAEVEGKRVTVCERFWNLPCARHVKVGKIANLFKDLDKRPVAVFMKHQSLEALDRIDGPASLDALLQAQEKVIAAWTGPRMSLKTWRVYLPHKEEGDRHFKQRAWRKAIDAYLHLRKAKEDSLKKLAEECLRPVDKEGHYLFGDAFKKSAHSSTREEAKKALRQIVKDFHPLPASVDAQNTLNALKRHGH